MSVTRNYDLVGVHFDHDLELEPTYLRYHDILVGHDRQQGEDSVINIIFGQQLLVHKRFVVGDDSLDHTRPVSDAGRFYNFEYCGI